MSPKAQELNENVPVVEDRRPRGRLAIAAAGIGALTGAGALYLLDRAHGARRRALLRDRLVSATSRLPSGADATLRDMRNRLAGLAAETRAMLSDEMVIDDVLVERVRSAMGRNVRHARAIEVRAEDGIVTLSGPVLRSEHQAALSTARRTRGVVDVEDALTVHESAGDVPALQGAASRPPDARPELLQENWSPTARVLTVAGGASMAGLGLMRRGVAGMALALGGAALAARGATNLALGRVLGVSGGRRGIDVRKTIHVEAPVGQVFALWSGFEEFPRFMSHVASVSRADGGRSRWVLKAPGGDVAYEAETTKLIENELIAWKTLPGQPIAHAGIVRFDAEGQGTRVDVRMTYNPPAGIFGHGVLALLGHDPRQAMDDDLLRMKSLIEHGRTTAEGETVERAEVGAGA